MFGPEFESRVEEIAARYPVRKAALLPVLREIQREKGWISLESEAWVADRLFVSAAHVHGVVSYISMGNSLLGNITHFNKDPIFRSQVILIKNRANYTINKKCPL